MESIDDVHISFKLVRETKNEEARREEFRLGAVWTQNYKYIHMIKFRVVCRCEKLKPV